MIYEIALDSKYANQEFDVHIDGVDKDIHIALRTVQDIILMSVTVDGALLGIPFICFANLPVIPYPYMVEKLGGNFMFVTENDFYPNYENFGTSCRLYFITSDDLMGID
jgi:hypothetical protein